MREATILKRSGEKVLTSVSFLFDADKEAIDWLVAHLNVDIHVIAVFRDKFLVDGSGFFFADIATGVNGKDGAILINHGSDELFESVVLLFDAVDDLLVHHRHVIVLGDVYAIDIGILYRISDGTRFNRFQGSFHVIVDVIWLAFWIKHHKGGDTLWDGRGWDDAGDGVIFVEDFARLAGSHDDVGVIREDIDVLRVAFLNGFDEILGGWVHRLATADDNVRAEFFEDLIETFARADGDDAELSFRTLSFRGRGFFSGLLFRIGDVTRHIGRGSAVLDIVMLFGHVLDRNSYEFTEVLGIVEHVARGKGMDVDLDDVIVTDENQGFTMGR